MLVLASKFKRRLNKEKVKTPSNLTQTITFVSKTIHSTKNTSTLGTGELLIENIHSVSSTQPSRS